MPSKNAFMFLCDQETESECLANLMVGTTQLNAIWAAAIKSGDDIYLFNFKSGVVRGPYSAASGVDCFDRSAWRGRFPIQVRISPTDYTRQADSRTANAPSVLMKKRPSGDLGTAAQELFLWLQTQSKST